MPVDFELYFRIVFHYLHYGLAAILIFIGAKMLLSAHYEIPILIALGVVAGLLAVSIVASLVHKPRGKPAAPSA